MKRPWPALGRSATGRGGENVYIIRLNESEVNWWVRTAGSVICCTSRPGKENWCYGGKGFHGSLVYIQRLFLCLGYGTGTLLV